MEKLPKTEFIQVNSLKGSPEDSKKDLNCEEIQRIMTQTRFYPLFAEIDPAYLDRDPVDTEEDLEKFLAKQKMVQDHQDECASCDDFWFDTGKIAQWMEIMRFRNLPEEEQIARIERVKEFKKWLKSQK